MGHDLGYLFSIFFLTKQYCKALGVVLNSGDVLYC